MANEIIEAEFVDTTAELITFFKESRRWDEAASIFVMAAYLKQMEEKLDVALGQISEIKEQLGAIEDRQEKTDRTLIDYLEKTSENMQEQYGEIKKELIDIKGEMTKKASGIVADVKQKGKEELNQVAEFFKLKERLTGFCEKVKTALSKVNQTIEHIDTFGDRMRQSGREMTNAVRAFTGKEEKEYGEQKFSKTELVKKPFLAQRKLLEEVICGTEKVLEKCESLSDSVQRDIGGNEKSEQNRSKEPIAFPVKGKSR